VLRLGIGFLYPDFQPLAYDWSDRTLLLPAFVFGFMLEGDDGFQRALDRHWRTALAIALAGSAALLAWAWPGHVLGRLPSPRSAAGVVLWGGYACTAWCWLVALAGGARRHLTGRRSGTVERASEMVYPFYVLHHPVVVAVAFIVVQWGIGVLAAFLFIAIVSFSVTVALCWVVAAQDVLRVLFGLRPHPYRAADAARRPAAARRWRSRKSPTRLS
jgi:peptidoglycan/LPS O-acetylase OafA/YrhL